MPATNEDPEVIDVACRSTSKAFVLLFSQRILAGTKYHWTAGARLVKLMLLQYSRSGIYRDCLWDPVPYLCDFFLELLEDVFTVRSDPSAVAVVWFSCIWQ